MASIPNTIISLYKSIFPPTNPRITRLRGRQSEMARALMQTRKTHKFHFLDLPPKVRTRVYSYVFAGNIVQVCSYNKDKTSRMFSIDERCQILFTNKLIYTEAWRYLYWHSDWKFYKVSSLDYITWGDGGLAKLQFAQKVIITNQDVLEIFTIYLDFFPNLKVLVIDLPTAKLTMKTRPELKNGMLPMIRKIKTGEYWSNKIAPFMPLATRRKFALKFAIKTVYQDDPGNPEMILIDVDKLTITRSFRPVATEPTYGFISMPSSEDPDAELSMVDSSDASKTRVANISVPRRSKRRVHEVDDSAAGEKGKLPRRA